MVTGILVVTLERLKYGAICNIYHMDPIPSIALLMVGLRKYLRPRSIFSGSYFFATITYSIMNRNLKEELK